MTNHSRRIPQVGSHFISRRRLPGLRPAPRRPGTRPHLRYLLELRWKSEWPGPLSIQFTKLEQQAALIHCVGIVHAEQMHRRAADFRPAGDDVVDMEWRQRLMFLAQTSILAPVPGAAANISAQALLHDYWALAARTNRFAFSCIMERNLPRRMRVSYSSRSSAESRPSFARAAR